MAMAGWMLAEARQAAWQGGVVAATSTAGSISQNLARNIEIYGQVLRGVQRRLPLLPALGPAPATDARNAFLFEQAGKVRFFGEILVLDTAGRAVFATAPALPERDFAQRDYFAHHRDVADDEPYLSFQRGSFEGKDVLVVSRRLSDRDGTFAGVIAGALRLDYLSSIAADTGLGPKDVIGLMLNGRLIARVPAIPKRIGAEVRRTQAAAALHKGPEGVVELVSTTDGTRRLYAYRHIGPATTEATGDNGLVVTVGLSLDAIYAGWYRRVFGTLASLGLLITTLVFLGILLHREVKRREQAQREVSDHAHNLEVVADNIPEHIVKFDWSGRRLFVSRSLAADMGVPVEDLLGGTIGGAVDPRDRAQLLQDLESLRTGRQSFRTTYRFTYPKRGMCLMEINASRLPDGSGVLMVARDVTEREKRHDDALRAERLQAIGRLTGGIAHEFNNLLAVQISALELLRDADLPPEAKDYADMAMQAAERGAELTAQMLSYGRQQMLAPRSVEIAAFLAEIEPHLRARAGQACQLRCSSDIGLTVMADPSRLEEALTCLVVNARDAMPGGGEIILAAAHGLPEGEQPAGPPRVVITVEDEGAGMTQDVLERACEPFFTTKGPPAAGLSLAMAQGFARQSGGDLRLFSTPGIGTVAMLLLPSAASQVETPPHPVSAAPRAGSRGQVLIADDIGDVRVVMADTIRQIGFEPLAAGQGSEALELLRSHPGIVVLVTDYAMPGMTGLELIAQARQLRPGLPALVVSGYAKEAMPDAVPDGVAVLTKPVRRQVLVDAIDAALGAG